MNDTVFKIVLEGMGNDAFVDDPRYEVGRILKQIREEFEGGADDGIIFDPNGNSVGHWHFGSEHGGVDEAA